MVQRLIKNSGNSWSNNKLINELGQGLGSKNRCFKLDEKSLIDITLKKIKSRKFKWH